MSDSVYMSKWDLLTLLLSLKKLLDLGQSSAALDLINEVLTELKQ